MKHMLLSFLLFSSIHIFGEGRIAREYKIISDTKSDTVTKGYCIITGKATYWVSPEERDGVVNGVVSTTDHKYRAVTDKEGRFMLRIPAKKVQIYFFKPHYKEIVTSNIDFKSQHVVEVEFYGVYDRPTVTVKKPVIYLYPEKEEAISVELFPKGELTFTYPEYKNGWNITATPEGLLKDKKGKGYPYLFWEAEQSDLTYVKEENGLKGFIVQKEEVVSFLEKQLTLIGLNDKESTDFITYWGPILQKNKYALVQFLIDEEYDEKLGDIKTTPKMETKKRVYILCTGLEDLKAVPQVVPQKFVPFERKGFTLVEWGGSEISIERQIN